MEAYLKLLDEVYQEGDDKSDRTGTGTYSVFGRMLKVDLSTGRFPLLTTKEVRFHAILVELLWFISGSTNIKWLKENRVNIWNEWADENGELGPVYGSLWRRWQIQEKEHMVFEKGTVYETDSSSRFFIDQLATAIERLKERPNCRRNIVTAWNPELLPRQALPPCHCLFQFRTTSDGKLDLALYQRSCDIFLGVPYNIASYSLLLLMVAQVTGYDPGTFTHFYGDLHLYKNHTAQAREQLSRDPRPLPWVRINRDVKSIDEFTIDDFELLDYDPYAKISAPVSV